MLITRNVQKPIETISRRSSQCFCWRTFLIVDIITRGRQSFAVGEIVGTAVRVVGSNGEKYLVKMLSMTMMMMIRMHNETYGRTSQLGVCFFQYYTQLVNNL